MFREGNTGISEIGIPEYRPFLGDINTDITTCNIVVFDIRRKSLKHTVYCPSSAVPRAADRRRLSTCSLSRFTSHPTVCCSLARVNIACVHLASPHITRVTCRQRTTRPDSNCQPTLFMSRHGSPAAARTPFVLVQATRDA